MLPLSPPLSLLSLPSLSPPPFFLYTLSSIYPWVCLTAGSLFEVGCSIFAVSGTNVQAGVGTQMFVGESSDSIHS